MKYKDQLLTSKWRRKRARIILASGSKCQLCSDNNLNHLIVHHKIYIDGLKAWEYDPKDLICLCKSCHYKIHSNDLNNIRLSKTKISYTIKKIIKTLPK